MDSLTNHDVYHKGHEKGTVDLIPDRNVVDNCIIQETRHQTQDDIANPDQVHMRIIPFQPIPHRIQNAEDGHSAVGQLLEQAAAYGVGNKNRYEIQQH